MTNKLTTRLLAIAGKLAADEKEIESEAGPKIARAGEPRIDVLRRIVDRHQYEYVDGYPVDAQTANMLVTVYDSLAKRGHDMSKFDRIPLPKLVDFGWSQVRSASADGLRSRRAMDFPTQEALDKYLKDHPDADKSNHKVVETKGETKEEPKKQEYDFDNHVRDLVTKHTEHSGGISDDKLREILKRFGNKASDIEKGLKSLVKDGYLKKKNNRWVWNVDGSFSASLMSRRAMYWGGPDRVYRLTRMEQENGTAVCPKCKKEMAKEPFTKSDKLYTCESCGFKVPTSKTTTTRVTIDVDKDTGEVDVDVTTAKGRRGSRSAVARELTAMDFYTQDALDKYLKEHPDADRSKHKVVKTKNKRLSPEELKKTWESDWSKMDEKTKKNHLYNYGQDDSVVPKKYSDLPKEMRDRIERGESVNVK